MARLTIQNVAAPNLSGTSQILANAAASLNSGLAAASGVLDKYNTGQQESADASVLSKIAGISSEEELGKFLGSGQLEGLNLSPTMRETVLGLRKGILANNQSRVDISQTQANTGLIGANTDRVRASTAIAQASEGRSAAEYQDGVNVRDARRALTPAVVSANIEGNQRGASQLTPTNFDFSRYATGGAERQDSFTGMTPNMQNGLAGLLSTADGEIGKGLQVYSGYRSADVQANIVSNNMDKYGLGSRRKEWEADVQNLGAAGAGEKWRPIMREAGLTKFVAMPGGSKHQSGQAADLKWNGQRLDQAPAAVRDWVKNNASRFGLSVPMAHEPWQVETSDARSGGTTNAQTGQIAPSNQRPAFTNLQEAIAASVYLNPADATKLLADAYAAQNLGQQRIDTANTAAQQEASAAAILAAVQDPTNVNTQGVVTDLINNPLIGNSNERIEAIARAQGLAGENGPLSGVLSPRVSTDETIKNSIELFNGREGANIASSVQSRLLNDSQKYVEDPAGALMSQFGMESTPELRNDLRTTINTLARETGVTPQLAAVALAENFNRNDTWGADPAADRFYVNNARSFIETNLSENALSRFNEQRVVSESRQRQVGALRLQLDTLRSQAAKYGANVPPALAQNIQSLQAQILTATNGEILKPTSGTQTQAPTQQDAGSVIAAAATPQPVVQQPTIQLPAAQNNPISQGQSGQVQLEPDAFDAKLTLQEAEYNRVQLRDYIETSGYREQLSATAPGSADRQLVIEALARRIQDDTRLTDAEKLGLLSAITGGN